MGNILIVNMEVYKQSKNRSRPFSMTKKHLLEKNEFLSNCYRLACLLQPRDFGQQWITNKYVLYMRLFIFALGGGGGGLVQFSVPSWLEKNEF